MAASEEIRNSLEKLPHRRTPKYYKFCDFAARKLNVYVYGFDENGLLICRRRTYSDSEKFRILRIRHDLLDSYSMEQWDSDFPLQLEVGDMIIVKKVGVKSNNEIVKQSKPKEEVREWVFVRASVLQIDHDSRVVVTRGIDDAVELDVPFEAIYPPTGRFLEIPADIFFVSCEGLKFFEGTSLCKDMFYTAAAAVKEAVLTLKVVNDNSLVGSVLLNLENGRMQDLAEHMLKNIRINASAFASLMDSRQCYISNIFEDHVWVKFPDKYGIEAKMEDWLLSLAPTVFSFSLNSNPLSDEVLSKETDVYAVYLLPVIDHKTSVQTLRRVRPLGKVCKYDKSVFVAHIDFGVFEKVPVTSLVPAVVFGSVLNFIPSLAFPVVLENICCISDKTLDFINKRFGEKHLFDFKIVFEYFGQSHPPEVRVFLPTPLMNAAERRERKGKDNLVSDCCGGTLSPGDLIMDVVPSPITLSECLIENGLVQLDENYESFIQKHFVCERSRRFFCKLGAENLR